MARRKLDVKSSLSPVFSGGKRKRKDEVKETEVFVVDHIVKLTELEAATFKATDAEVRNALQGLKILELEMRESERKFYDEKETRLRMIDNLKNQQEVKYKEYRNLVEEISKKYKIDPHSMTIDPDTRVIRDLKNEASTA
jgi:hypothetical protein